MSREIAVATDRGERAAVAQPVKLQRAVGAFPGHLIKNMATFDESSALPICCIRLQR